MVEGVVEVGVFVDEKVGTPQVGRRGEGGMTVAVDERGAEETVEECGIHRDSLKVVELYLAAVVVASEGAIDDAVAELGLKNHSFDWMDLFLTK